jgi:hypothetical protein
MESQNKRSNSDGELLHDHMLCRQLAGELPFKSPTEINVSNTSKILLYARKSEDITDVFNALKDVVTYIHRHADQMQQSSPLLNRSY